MLTIDVVTFLSAKRVEKLKRVRLKSYADIVQERLLFAHNTYSMVRLQSMKL